MACLIKPDFFFLFEFVHRWLLPSVFSVGRWLTINFAAEIPKLWNIMCQVSVLLDGIFLCHILSVVLVENCMWNVFICYVLIHINGLYIQILLFIYTVLSNVWVLNTKNFIVECFKKKKKTMSVFLPGYEFSVLLNSPRCYTEWL